VGPGGWFCIDKVAHFGGGHLLDAEALILGAVDPEA